MNVPTVHSAVMRTTLMAPMTAAPQNTRPGVITSPPPPPPDPEADPSWPNRSFRVLKTPRALSTPYRTATATIQMKNSAIDRTSEIFSADQVSMCRNCSRARRGPRLFAGRPRTRGGAPGAAAGAPGGTALGWVPGPGAVAADGGTAGVLPVAGGKGGAPAGWAGALVAAEAPVAGP